MKKNNVENFRSSWVKYSNYEIIEIEGIQYITPTEDSKVKVYDPFDFSDDILVDILMIGKKVEQNNIDSAIEDTVTFTKKYGLLGQLTYLPLNENFLMYDNVYLPPNNGFGLKEVVSIEEYLNIFLKCPKKQKINMQIKKDKTVAISVENEISPILSFDKPQEFTIVFSRVYSESIVSFLAYANYLYLVFEAIEKFNTEKSEYNKTKYFNTINSFKASKIACKVLVGNKEDNIPMLEWDFNSLRLAINTIFALNETNERKTVKMCKHCGNPFSSGNLKAEYCSPQCRNRANVYKSRAKNK